MKKPELSALERIRIAVSMIKVEKKDTEIGKAQREAFRGRWGKKPEEI